MAERKMQRDDRKIYGVYLQSVLTMKVIVPITSVGKNMKQNLETTFLKTILSSAAFRSKSAV
jgi:hypothetical protein